LAEKQFKQEVALSDKSFAFTLPGRSNSDRVFCYEAAIDAISAVSLFKRHGLDWRQDSHVALGGTSFLGLNRFLEENPNVRHITVCLDNDETGRRRGDKLAREFSEKGFMVDFAYPIAKDYNQDLLNEIGAEKLMRQESERDEFEYD